MISKESMKMVLMSAYNVTMLYMKNVLMLNYVKDVKGNYLKVYYNAHKDVNIIDINIV